MQTALIIAAASGVAILLLVEIRFRRARAALIRLLTEPLDKVNFIGICYRCLKNPAPGNELYCDTCRPIVDANPAEPIEKQGDAK